MKKSLILTSGLLAAIAATAQTNNISQTETDQSSVKQDAGTIVVSATRIDTPVEQIGSSFSITPSRQINQMNAKDAQSAVRQTPGVQLAQTGGPGTASSVFIRGANANHTLVLVNGIRVNSNTTGSFNLSTLPTDSIERIEVLRGPQSALYGGDAIGGVVNIVTKKGQQGLGGSILAETGSKGYANGLVNVYGGGEQMDFTANLSFNQLREFDIALNNGGTEKDPYKRVSVFTDFGLNFADDGRADLVFMYNKLDTSLDGWKGFDTPNKSTETEFWSTSLDVSKPVTDIYEQRFKFGFNEEQNTGIDVGVESYYFETRNFDFNAQADLFVLDNYTFHLGYDFRLSEALNRGNYETIDRKQNSLYLNNSWTWDDRLFVTLGGRFDDYSDFDSKVTGQATASLNLLDSTRLHSSVGTGYRVPTFNDLYWPYSASTSTFFGTTYISEQSGNPNLDAEESISFDIGLEQSFFEKTIVADVTFFMNEVDDLIQWENVSTNTSLNPVFSFYTPRNVNNAEIWGVETSLTYQPVDEFSTRLYYTYTHAVDGDTDFWLARRARDNAGISVSYDYLKNATVSADLVYVGKRFDDPENNTPLEAYELVNLGTSYAITDSFKVLANVNNLLNKYYETAAGYGTVGRVVSAGVEVSF